MIVAHKGWISLRSIKFSVVTRPRKKSVMQMEAKRVLTTGSLR